MRKCKFYFLLAASLLCGCTSLSSVSTTNPSPETELEVSDNNVTTTEEASSYTEEEEAEEDMETEESTEATIEEAHETEETSDEEESDTEIIFYSCDDVMYLTVNANIRLEPSLDSGIYCILTAGTEVQLVAKSDEWAIISITGAGTYYVSTSLLISEAPETSDEEAAVSDEAAASDSQED